MRNLWRKIQDRWFLYWQEDSIDMGKKHLSQSDKRSLLYGGFIIGALTLIGCLFVVIISNYLLNQRYNKDVQDTMNMIATYFATATEDEYDKIAQTIRRDLVNSQYGQDIEYFIKYIPNTAESCCLEQEGYVERINLVFLNTGLLYGLDIFDKTQSMEKARENGGRQLTFGYDEVSKSHLTIQKEPYQDTGTVTLFRERGIVSSHKMKSLFCDECIRNILNIVENELVNEAVIYDTEEKRFYPIKEGNLQIGNYKIQTVYKEENYIMKMKYKDQ